MSRVQKVSGHAPLVSSTGFPTTSIFIEFTRYCNANFIPFWTHVRNERGSINDTRVRYTREPRVCVYLNHTPLKSLALVDNLLRFYCCTERFSVFRDTHLM